MENNEQNSSVESNNNIQPNSGVEPNNVNANNSNEQNNQIIESAASGIESSDSISKPQGNEENMTVKSEVQTPEVNTTKKNTKIIPIAIIGVVLVACLAFGITGFVKKMGNPYHNAVSMVFEALSNSKLLTDSYKTTAEVKFNFTNEELKQMNDVGYKIETSSDFDNLKSFFKMTLLNKGNELFDVSGLLKDNKMYVSSKKLLDKVVYYDAGELLKDSNKIKKDDIEYLLGRLEVGIKNAFDDEKATVVDEKLTINGKEVSVKNNYYLINSSNYVRILKNVILAFSDDKTIEVLSRISGIEKDEIKKYFEEVEKEDTNTNEEANAEQSVKFSIYTKGITKSLVGFAVSLTDEIKASYLVDKDYSIFELIYSNVFSVKAETNDKVTDVKIVYNGKEIASIKVNQPDDNNADITFNVPEYGSIIVKIKYEKISNVEEFDVSNAVTIDSLTEEDLSGMLEKLENIFKDAGIEIEPSDVNIPLISDYTNTNTNNYDLGDYDYNYGSEDLNISNEGIGDFSFGE